MEDETRDLKADVKVNLERILNRASDLGSDPAKIKVVAVTKGRPLSDAAAAVAAGLCDLGENYANELAAKAKEFAESPQAAEAAADNADTPPCQRAPRWHFIGNLQRNKVRKIAHSVALWQSVDRLPTADEIARRSPGARVLLQVSPQRLPGRGGCPPDEIPLLLEQSRAAGLNVEGLMAMALQGPPEQIRSEFRSLRSLADGLELPTRSMGTSSDWEAALLEGANMLRLGRVLFTSSGI